MQGLAQNDIICDGGFTIREHLSSEVLDEQRKVIRERLSLAKANEEQLVRRKSEIITDQLKVKILHYHAVLHQIANGKSLNYVCAPRCLGLDRRQVRRVIQGMRRSDEWQRMRADLIDKWALMFPGGLQCNAYSEDPYDKDAVWQRYDYFYKNSAHFAT